MAGNTEFRPVRNDLARNFAEGVFNGVLNDFLDGFVWSPAPAEGGQRADALRGRFYRGDNGFTPPVVKGAA